jgi:beta-lactamase regulating signal transducer with metallopeptidase domain
MIAALFTVVREAWAFDAAWCARVLAALYTLTLTSTIPMLAAAVVWVLSRRSSFGNQALVWRSATLAVAIVCVGNLLAVHTVTAVVPPSLAAPLVALGKLQLADSVASGLHSSADVKEAVLGDARLVMLLVSLWGAGALGVTVWTWRGWREVGAAVRNARRLDSREWEAALYEACESLGVRRPVLLSVGDVRVPFTCGVFRPSVVLPLSSAEWSASERRTVLLHELAHVCERDVVYALGLRITCAVLWFHPGVWVLARRLRQSCEHAADDRVLTSGVRASDYAELLVQAVTRADARDDGALSAASFALSRDGGVRDRLTAIVDTARDRRAPLRRTMAFAAAMTVAVAAPSASVRLAPTRDVLTTLMRESAWESRAYAVIGLAQRADSLDVARAAALGDPSPNVRAWAKLALSRSAAARRAAHPPMSRAASDQPIAQLPRMSPLTE